MRVQPAVALWVLLAISLLDTMWVFMASQLTPTMHRPLELARKEPGERSRGLCTSPSLTPERDNINGHLDQPKLCLASG